MDFIRNFEDHHIERIRRAIIAFRNDHKIGDVKLADRLSIYYPEDRDTSGTIKNLQRLRQGKNIRGTFFLNACVKLLEVEMKTPPEEELGLAMMRFIGQFHGYKEMWEQFAGEYSLKVYPLQSTGIAPQGGLAQTFVAVGRGIPVSGSKEKSTPVRLSIGPGEGNRYGVAKETYPFHGNGKADGGPVTLHKSGVCLPIGKNDFLVLMRDFLFSHMYVLRRQKNGFIGTFIMPSVFEYLAVDIPTGLQQPQYGVVLQKLEASIGAGST